MSFCRNSISHGAKAETNKNLQTKKTHLAPPKLFLSSCLGCRAACSCLCGCRLAPFFQGFWGGSWFGRKLGGGRLCFPLLQFTQITTCITINISMFGAGGNSEIYTYLSKGHISIYLFIYTHMCMYMCIYIHIYIYRYTYANVYMHTNTHA